MNPNHLLADSIHRFLTSYRTGSTDFSHFTSISSRFIHHTLPPLELLWFHSALTFHSLQPHFPSLDKDLFPLLVSGSYPFSGPTTRVAALAPLISLLFHNNNNNNNNGSLLERVIGYIGVCCNGGGGLGFGEEEEEGVLGECFVELARVWMVERVGEGCGIEEVLEGFLPGVSVGVRRRVGCEGGCGVGYLAGVVMWEVLLLGFCFKVERKEIREELRDWVVRTLGAFQSYHFFDILLSMLLEPSIPVNSLLNSRDRDLLCVILYDAVIMECPFLNPAKGFQLPDTYWKNLAITWLFVVDKAVHFARENGDEARAVSYIQAFSESNLPSQLINYIIGQPCVKRHPNILSLSTPLALIKWLVYTDDQGAMVFDNDIVKNYARTVACQSTMEHELVVSSSSCEKSEEHFHAGNKGKWEDKLCGEVDIWKRLDSPCFTTPSSKKMIEYDRSRKRKEGCVNEWGKQVKLVRCHLQEDPMRQMVLPSVEDGLSCGSEVENPITDDDMAYMEV